MTVILTLFATGLAVAAPDPPSLHERRIPRKGDAAELRAAIAERVAFDGETIEIDGDSIVLRRAAPIESWDRIALQLAALDADSAARVAARALSDAGLAARFDAAFPGAPREPQDPAGESLLLEIVRRGGGCVARSDRRQARRRGRRARAERARLDALAESLPTTGGVFIVRGGYGPSAYPSVPRESAEGRLLAAGRQAVPSLLRVARNADAPAVRRAWAPAILASLTDGFGQVGSAALGPCTILPEKRTIGAFVERIDPAAQDRVAEAWTKIAAGVEFRETP